MFVRLLVRSFGVFASQGPELIAIGFYVIAPHSMMRRLRIICIYILHTEVVEVYMAL